MGAICLIILVIMCISSNQKAAKNAKAAKKKWDEDNIKYGFTFWTDGKDGK
jgi:hypothetical protein